MTIVIDGMEQVLEIIRRPRIHGTQGFWLCPLECRRPRMHLYVARGEVGTRNSEIGCRECLGLTYAVRCTRNTAALRARKLRRRLGGLPNPLGPLPPRPKHWRKDYWERRIGQLLAIESALTARLGAMVERRRSKRDRRSNRAA